MVEALRIFVSQSHTFPFGVAKINNNNNIENLLKIITLDSKSNMDVAETTGDKSVTTTADLAKNKFKNFLILLIRLAGEHGQPPQAAVKVRSLIQALIDDQINPEYFSTQIQKELNSAPQSNPYIIPYIKTCLPHLRQSLLNGELSIDGLRPPPSNKALGHSGPGIPQ